MVYIYSRNKLYIVAIFLLVFITTQSVWAVMHAYPELIDQISYELVEILNKNGLYIRHDRGSSWLDLSAGSNRYTINYFQADEIPFAAKIETVRFLLKLYEDRGRKERFRVKMFRETQEEVRAPFYERGTLFGKVPFFEMTIGDGDN